MNPRIGEARCCCDSVGYTDYAAYVNDNKEGFREEQYFKRMLANLPPCGILGFPKITYLWTKLKENMKVTGVEEKLYSFEQYLAFEQQSEAKHEFYDGKLIPMAGGTLNHSIIANMIGALVLNFLLSKNRDCQVANSDLKVYIPRTNRGVYPDVTVICDEPQFYLGSPAVITNPQLIVEVLSTETESYDRTTKFENYCSIPSFREYVLVAQDRPFIEAFYLHDPETQLWKINRASGLEASITLLSLGCELKLKEVYRGVKGLVE